MWVAAAVSHSLTLGTMRLLCLRIHRPPVYYGNGGRLPLQDRRTKNKPRAAGECGTRRCLCVFVLVVQSRGFGSGRIPIWKRMQRQQPHEIALCGWNMRVRFPFGEAKLPENILTKHYIMSNSPKYSRPVNKSRIRIWSGFVKEEEEEEGRGNKRVKVWDTCGQC